MTKNIYLLDGDDVLLKTGERKIRWLKENLSNDDILDKTRTIESLQPYECSRTILVPIIGADAYDKMGFYVYSREGTLEIEPMEGALEGVKELSNTGEIYVVSARRPDHAQNMEEWSKLNDFHRYLTDVASTKDPKYETVPKVEDSKKVGIGVYLGAKMFVDDDGRHMPKNSVTGLDCILFGPIERDVGEHIIVAKNWDDVISHTRKYD